MIGYPNLTYLLIGQNFVNIMITELSERRIDLHPHCHTGGKWGYALSIQFLYVCAHVSMCTCKSKSIIVDLLGSHGGSLACPLLLLLKHLPSRLIVRNHLDYFIYKSKYYKQDENRLRNQSLTLLRFKCQAIALWMEFQDLCNCIQWRTAFRRAAICATFLGDSKTIQISF